jgi:hypothetical protein
MDNGHLDWLEEKTEDSLRGVKNSAEPETGTSQAQGRRPVQASLPFEED